MRGSSHEPREEHHGRLFRSSPVHRARQRKVCRAGARILVADDDQELRNLYAAILAFEGYEVAVAANGVEALEQLSTGTFQLLLTDLQMPVVDGEMLVLALRSAGMRIPVVVLSGSVPDRPLRRRVAREVAIALSKPAPAAKVLAAVFLALHPTFPNLSLAA